MTIEQNKNVSRRLREECFSKGNLSVADELMAPNALLHDPMHPGVAGPEGMKQIARIYRGAFGDLRMTIEDQIAEGDRVVTRWTASGTHTGNLLGIPPTHRKVTVTGIDIDRIADGKIKESWSNWDAIGMFRQLGLSSQQLQQVLTAAPGASAQAPAVHK